MVKPGLSRRGRATANSKERLASQPAEDKQPAEARTEPAEGPGHEPSAPDSMSPLARTMIGIWIVALAAVSLGHLPWAWAIAVRLTGAKSSVHVHWLGVRFTPQKASILLIIVMLTAVIGSVATLALTFAHRAGYNKLEKGWGWWYLTRPFTAAGIGVLAYALLQVGFFGSNNATSQELFAAAAIGGLAGLFTDQLLQKMRGALGLTAFLKSASDTDETKKVNAS